MGLWPGWWLKAIVIEAWLGSGGGYHRWGKKVVQQNLHDLVTVENDGGCSLVWRFMAMASEAK